MKIDTANDKIKIGATRKELYTVLAGLMALIQWYCTHK